MEPELLNYARPGTIQKRRKSAAVGIAFLLAAFFLLFSIISPWLNRRDPPPRRLVCASNLRQIGQAIAIYAAENGGWLPPDLKTVAEKEDLLPNAFVCPASHDTAAAPGPTSQATANNIMQPGHHSYIYIGKGMHWPELPDDAVIAYEPLANHGGAGMNVLFGDLHVEWLNASEAAPVLSQIASKQRPVRYPLTMPTTGESSAGVDPGNVLAGSFLIVKEMNQGAHPTFVCPSTEPWSDPCGKSPTQAGAKRRR